MNILLMRCIASWVTNIGLRCALMMMVLFIGLLRWEMVCGLLMGKWFNGGCFIRVGLGLLSGTLGGNRLFTLESGHL